MQRIGYLKRFLGIFVAAGVILLLGSAAARGQEVRSAPSSSASSANSDSPAEVRALSDLIRDLQVQVQALNTQLGDLREEQKHSSDETRELRRQLDLLKRQGAPAANGGPLNPYSAPPAKESSAQPASNSSAGPSQSQTAEDRISKLEEDQESMDAKINDQYQTKVESGSKYRLRLSGVLLMNLYENRGTVDNQDFPEVAQSEQSQAPLASGGAFGGTLRQSQVRLQAFGPDVAGARTSADVNLDFAGGFPDAPNGAWMGLIRLRTAIVRLDWTSTSIIAGQDRLFFAPLAPTSLATLATPALSYAGNLWGWTPQLRVEHRIAWSDTSSLSIQGGILDSLTGDIPPDQFDRYPSWGELSGIPAFAARVAWSHRVFGQDLIVGTGGYYGRQGWGFGRSVDGWAATADLTLPLGKRFELTGALYRGRAMGGFGGGIGQDVVINGPFVALSTTIRGLNSMGGWAQLKYKVKSNFEINGAFGSDNAFAGDFRLFNANALYPGAYTRNLSPFVNFIYQIRSDILFSTEYRYLNTSMFDGGSVGASQINLALGYIF